MLHNHILCIDRVVASKYIQLLHPVLRHRGLVDHDTVENAGLYKLFYYHPLEEWSQTIKNYVGSLLPTTLEALCDLWIWKHLRARLCCHVRPSVWKRAPNHAESKTCFCSRNAFLQRRWGGFCVSVPSSVFKVFPRACMAHYSWGAVLRAMHSGITEYTKLIPIFGAWPTPEWD